MKPRILHVIKTLELGGAETNLRNLLQAFDPEKFEHHIAYAFGGEIEDFFRKNPVAVLYRYSRGKHRNTSLHSLLIIARLWFYIVSRRIRVVHTHNFNAHFWGVYAAKLTGAKVVEHVHDQRYLDIRELERRKSSANLNRYIGMFKGLSDRVVVLTGQNKRFLIEKGFYPEKKVKIILNGIPMPADTSSTRESAARELGFDPNIPVVLVASRMIPLKNFDLVLRIAPAVARQVPDVLFLAAGNGECLEEYKKEAARMDLGKNLRFIGYYADIDRLLRACDIYFQPSFLELHSISILEAMSVGVPVVASSGVGSNSEIYTHEKDAFLLDPFSEEGWAEVLVRLLKDAGLRRALGKNGQELCRRRFDIHRTAAAFEALYEELGAAPKR